MQRWLDEAYPSIEQRARAEGGEITGVTKPPGQHRCARSQLRTGDRQDAGGLRRRRHAAKLSMIATVTNQARRAG